MKLPTRKAISAENVSDPQAAAALRVHTSERSHLLASLSKSFEQDPRIRAAWLWGSFMRGEQDDLSDLDIWLLVQNSSVEPMGPSLKAYGDAAGTVVSSGENPHNAPSGGGYFGALLAGTHGLHHLDIYLQPVSSEVQPEGPVLVDRRDEACEEVAAVAKLDAPEESPLEVCQGRIAFVWLMLSVAAKYLAREPSSDMKLLSYPRQSFEEVVAALGMEGQIGDVNWDAPDEPMGKVRTLRHVAGKTALLEEACLARGLEISKEANPCLRRYFDLVERLIA